MHVHPALPWVGSAWRRRVQGFRTPILDGSGSCGESSFPDDSTRLPASRIYGAVFYVTYLLRPASARLKLFASLKAFRARFAANVDAEFRHPDTEVRLAEGTSGPPRRSLPGRLLLSAADLPFESLPPPRAQAGAPELDSVFLAVESMRCLRDPGDVRRLWDLGVRSLQPIHFLDTPWGGSSREGMLPESRTGLTGLGREMLAEMAALGLILDLAHMSRNNAEACLSAYPGPVMCSHTGLFSLRATARNITAELASEIFRRRGLVGVTCWRHLLGAAPRPAHGHGHGEASGRSDWTRAYCATIAALADLHPTARLAIGSDRGAPILVPAWFYSPEHLREMESLLAAQGWPRERIRGFFSGNAGDFLGRSLPSHPHPHECRPV